MATRSDEGCDFRDICSGNGSLNGAVGEYIWGDEDRHMGLLRPSCPGVDSHPASCEVDSQTPNPLLLMLYVTGKVCSGGSGPMETWGLWGSLCYRVLRN